MIFIICRKYLWNYASKLHQLFEHFACGRGSVLFWRRCYMVCTSGCVFFLTVSGPHRDTSLPLQRCDRADALATWYWLRYFPDDGGHRDWTCNGCRERNLWCNTALLHNGITRSLQQTGSRLTVADLFKMMISCLFSYMYSDSPQVNGLVDDDLWDACLTVNEQPLQVAGLHIPTSDSKFGSKSAYGSVRTVWCPWIWRDVDAGVPAAAAKLSCDRGVQVRSF